MVKKIDTTILLPGKNDVETVSKKLPVLTGIHPAGSSILLEMLNPEEILGTKLHMREDAKVGSIQGYIVEFGHCIDPATLNLKVGDRVLIQGKPMELKEAKQFSDRKLCIVEVHNIKAKFDEDK